jgi:hypothetical protein
LPGISSLKSFGESSPHAAHQKEKRVREKACQGSGNPLNIELIMRGGFSPKHNKKPLFLITG